MEFKERDKPWAWVFDEKISCTVCGEQVNPFGTWHAHPKLNAIQCADCNKFYHKGHWAKDEEGYYEHCRWCGEGGLILGCDSCIESFCKTCIKRNFGRDMVSRIENMSKWKCFLCDIHQLKKLNKKTEKIKEARRQREEWLQQCRDKARERKEKKLASNSRISSSSLSPHSDRTGTNGDNTVSTDEDEIDEKIHILLKRLESKLENPRKTVDEKLRTKSKVEKIARKFDALHKKGKQLEKEWPKPVATNGVINGGAIDSSSGESASDSDDSSGNEDALFGLSRKKKRRDVNDHTKHTRIVSSDEWSDEETAKKIKEDRQKKLEEKAERLRQNTLKRELEIAAKLSAEEEKRKLDNERIRSNKQSAASKVQFGKKDSDSMPVSPAKIDECPVSPKSDKSDKPIEKADSPAEKSGSPVEKPDDPVEEPDSVDSPSSDVESSKKEKKSTKTAKKSETAKKSTDKKVLGSDSESDYENEEKDDDSDASEDDLEFLNSDEDADESQEVKSSKNKSEDTNDDPIPIEDSGDEVNSGDEDVDEKLKEKKKDKKVNGQAKKKEERKTRSSDEDEPTKKSKKSNKLLDDKIEISSDSDLEEKIKKSKEKTKKQKKEKEEKVTEKKSSKKRKRVILSDSDNEFASDSDGDEDKKSKKKRRKKKKKKSDDDDSENDSDKENETKKEKTKSRKIMTDEKLSESTKQAEADEKERKLRLEKLRAERSSKSSGKGLEFESRDWNGVLNKEPLVEVDSDLRSNLKTHQIEGIEFMWDSTVESVTKIENAENDKKDEPKYRLGKTDIGHGCILAHCMGLGKTLQAITLLHTLYTHEFIGLNKFVVLCPLNVCENWILEVEKWTADLGQPIYGWNLHSTTDINERLDMTKEWSKDGGILVMGYTLFRMLSTGKNVTKKTKYKVPKFKELILRGADVVVCDEGHQLKNSESAISKACKEFKSLRRIVLTGTPMQNNLDEYHCMVDFVRPSLLGTNKEFRNRFANPIRNGENIDASDYDVKLMKKRAFILHKTLDGVVQRKDYSYMCKHLPPKQEYVLSLRHTETQAKLYEYYLKNKSVALAASDKISGRGLFSDFQTFLLVNNHPKALLNQTENHENKAERDLVRNFVCESDDSSEEEFDEKKLDEMSDKMVAPEPVDEDELLALSSLKMRSYIMNNYGSLLHCNPADPRDLARRAVEIFRKNVDPDNEYLEEEIHSLKRQVLKDFIIRKGGNDDDITGKSKTELREHAAYLHRKKVEPPPEMEWYEKCLGQNFDFDDFSLSVKLASLFEIINICFHLKDKLIVFSQSVLTLDIIEGFLASSTLRTLEEIGDVDSEDEEKSEPKKKNTCFIGGQKWYKNIDYFRIDGSVAASKRTNQIDNFNNVDDERARLFLVSTKAGGIGTNLVGANRVIIFDSSWNPAHDVQSLFRVYRFGQTKNVFVYRFVGFGTMEEKIYERQVNKSSLGLRVVDEQQIDRHYSADQLKDLYKYVQPPADPERLAPPKDQLLSEIMSNSKTKSWIVNYHMHDSLLEHKPEESLTKEEIDKAWEEYENEKKGIYTSRPSSGMYNAGNMQQYHNRHNFSVENANWVQNLGKLTLDSIVKIGKTLFESDYKEFFANRREVTVSDIVQLLFIYDPKQNYVTAMQLAQKIHTYLRTMHLNERSLYQAGMSMLKQCEQRISEIHYTQHQRPKAQKIQAAQFGNRRIIQPK